MSAFTRLAQERAKTIQRALLSSRSSALPWQISTWEQGLGRSASVDRGGVAVVPLTTDAESLSASLEEYSPSYVGEKNQGPLLISYATHVAPERGGHRDEDCGSITGLILDCDVGGSSETVLDALEAADLSFTYSYKPATGKFHVIVQLVPIVVPRDTDGSVKYGYAREHQALFEFAIDRLSELAGVQFDRAMAPILMHIDFPACRKFESDPLPRLEAYSAGALDLEAFCKTLGYVPPVPMKRVSIKAVDACDDTEVTTQTLKTYLEGKVKVLTFRGYTEKKWKHADRLKRALEGKAPVEVGGLRNQIWYREICGSAGAATSGRYPKVSTESLASLLTEVFTPALEAQHEQDVAKKLHKSPSDADALEDMFYRSISDFRAREERERAKEKAEETT